MSHLLLHLLLLVTPSYSTGPDTLPLQCDLHDSDDRFLFYRSQMVYRSEQFVIFQNFKGRVVSQVDMKTGELIRTTYIGDGYTPQYQILLGQCSESQHILDFWALDDISFDSH